jgi:hypothetical protein
VLTTPHSNSYQLKKDLMLERGRQVTFIQQSKSYTVVFYLKIASAMTLLGMMKQGSGLYMLRTNNFWIRAFHFTTTYDVINTGFSSHTINGSLHNRDKINKTLQKTLQMHYP